MLDSVPGESFMYFSPALVSHSILEPTSTHMPRFLGASANAMIDCHHGYHACYTPGLHVRVVVVTVAVAVVAGTVHIRLLVSLTNRTGIEYLHTTGTRHGYHACRTLEHRVRLHVRFVVAIVVVVARVGVGVVPVRLFVSLRNEPDIGHSHTGGTRHC